jgi:hypothetical protein
MLPTTADFERAELYSQGLSSCKAILSLSSGVAVDPFRSTCHADALAIHHRMLRVVTVWSRMITTYRVTFNLVTVRPRMS